MRRIPRERASLKRHCGGSFPRQNGTKNSKPKKAADNRQDFVKQSSRLWRRQVVARIGRRWLESRMPARLLLSHWMWNTISRFFAKGSKTAVQETAAPPLPPSTTTTEVKDEQQQQQRACNGVADDDAPGDGTSAAHVFYDATMDRGASADDRRRPAAASAVAAGAAATAADQQSGGGDSEYFPDAYDSRQVSCSLFLHREVGDRLEECGVKMNWNLKIYPVWKSNNSLILLKLKKNVKVKIWKLGRKSDVNNYIRIRMFCRCSWNLFWTNIILFFFI